jgi:hypothetical protein
VEDVVKAVKDALVWFNAVTAELKYLEIRLNVKRGTLVWLILEF